MPQLRRHRGDERCNGRDGSTDQSPTNIPPAHTNVLSDSTLRGAGTYRRRMCVPERRREVVKR